MQVRRYSSGVFGRQSRRLPGCAPLFVLALVALAVVGLGRDWIGQWLYANRTQRAPLDLSAAQVAFDSGDLDAAVDIARQALAREPDDADAYALLVRALIYRSYSEIQREADRVRALEESRVGLERLPRDLAMQAIHAYALGAAGDWAQAGRIARRVLERAPDQVLARIVLSLAYGAGGSFEAALTEAERARAEAEAQGLDPIESYRALAIARRDLAQYPEAILALERAIVSNSALIPLHLELALVAQQISDFDRATVAYFRVLSLDERNVKARARLCELGARLQERQSALRSCREVTELAPEWSPGWHKLGQEYWRAGEYAEAQAAFQQCASLQVAQGVAIAERELNCWYLQGQSAEIRGDCAALLMVYEEFLVMVERGNLRQTWTYPPGGPPVCAEP